MVERASNLDQNGNEITRNSFHKYSMNKFYTIISSNTPFKFPWKKKRKTLKLTLPHVQWRGKAAYIDPSSPVMVGASYAAVFSFSNVETWKKTADQMPANANKTPEKSGRLLSSHCRQNRHTIHRIWNHVLLIRCVVANFRGLIRSYFFLGTEFSLTWAGYAWIWTKVWILVLLVVELEPWR